MSHKIFPRTYDKDQIRIIFDALEEKQAFESVVIRLSEVVASMTFDIPSGTNPSIADLPSFDFDFRTTLENTSKRFVKLLDFLHLMFLSQTHVYSHA